MNNKILLTFALVFCILCWQQNQHNKLVKVLDQELSDSRLRLAYLEGGDQ